MEIEIDGPLDMRADINGTWKYGLINSIVEKHCVFIYIHQTTYGILCCDKQ